jgi:co-chaperonin GroES (HSP10)
VSGSSSFAPLVVFDQTLAEAFPKVDPGRVPLGSRVLVQIRSPKTTTKSGIVLPDEVRDTITWNTTVAKVRAVGPVAFRNRTTLEPWPEGAWIKEGDFVTVPKYGGDRFEVKLEKSGEVALFAVFNDLDMVAKVTCDPRDVIAFV